MLDAFLAAFQAHDPQNGVCVLRTITCDFQHDILRRLLSTDDVASQSLIEGDTLELVFDFYDATRLARPRSSWRLWCVGVQYHHFWRNALEPVGDLTITRDHVLLWPHHYPRKDLWVRGKHQLSFTALAALAQEHYRLVEEWLPLARTLHLDTPLSPAAGTTNHLLASGPAPLIEAYLRVLANLGVDLTLRDSPRPFMIINNTKYWTDPANPIAVIFGRSYVVATDILAQRIEATPRHHVRPP